MNYARIVENQFAIIVADLDPVGQLAFDHCAGMVFGGFEQNVAVLFDRYCLALKGRRDVVRHFSSDFHT